MITIDSLKSSTVWNMPKETFVPKRLKIQTKFCLLEIEMNLSFCEFMYENGTYIV